MLVWYHYCLVILEANTNVNNWFIIWPQIDSLSDNQRKQVTQLIDDLEEARRPPRTTGVFNDPGDGLGPLPQKWETAYTERGEMYFIE